MRRAIGVSTLVVLLLAVGCGGGSGSNSNDNGGNSNGSQGLSGAYEFVAVSSEPNGQTTIIGANLVANGSDVTASGPNQIQVVGYLNNTWDLNSRCARQGGTVHGTVSGDNVSLTFSEGQNSFSAQGTLSGSTVSGTYSGKSGECTDSGTFTGKPVSPLSGTFAGTLNLGSGPDQVSATFTETQSQSLTMNATLAGADNGTFVFSGTAVGNVAYVSGNLNGNTLVFFAYYDKDGTYTGIPKSMVFFDDNSLMDEGLLVQQ